MGPGSPLRDWLGEYSVERVAMESTGIYWRVVYWSLHDRFEMIVANAREIHDLKKARRKTDKIDSVWIAKLCLNNMITPSYVPNWEIQQHISTNILYHLYRYTSSQRYFQ